MVRGPVDGASPDIARPTFPFEKSDLEHAHLLDRALNQPRAFIRETSASVPHAIAPGGCVIEPFRSWSRVRADHAHADLVDMKSWAHRVGGRDESKSDPFRAKKLRVNLGEKREVCAEAIVRIYPLWQERSKIKPSTLDLHRSSPRVLDKRTLHERGDASIEETRVDDDADALLVDRGKVTHRLCLDERRDDGR